VAAVTFAALANSEMVRTGERLVIWSTESDIQRGLLVEYLQHRPSEYDVDVPSGIVSSLVFRMCIAADRDVGFIGSMTDGGQAGAKSAEEGNRPTATSCPDWWPSTGLGPTGHRCQRSTGP
jgi:hypothetical protein